jgi:hypothetical protein
MLSMSFYIKKPLFDLYELAAASEDVREISPASQMWLASRSSIWLVVLGE